jgi:hypothetical protein
MKNLKTFEGFFNFKKEKGVDIDEDIILNLVRNENDPDVKQILLIISNHVNQHYVTISEDNDFITDESIEKIKSLGFLVKVYDDSNEYSDDFANKVKISWNYIGENIEDIDE